MKYFPIYQKFVPTRVNKHYLSPVASITRRRVKPEAFRNGLHALSWVTVVTRVYSELNRVNNLKAVIIVKYYSFLKRKQHYADLQSFHPLSRRATILQFIIPLNANYSFAKFQVFAESHIRVTPFSWRAPGPPEIWSRESDNPSDTSVVHIHVANAVRSILAMLRRTASHIIYMVRLSRSSLFASASKFVAYPLRCEAPWCY